MTTPPPPQAVLARARLFWQRTLHGPSSTRREALYEELASLLQAGFGVRQALASLAGRGRGANAVVAIWEDQVARGEPLAEGMLAHPEACDPLEALVIRAGERSGRLVEQLRRLSTVIAAQRENRRRLVAKLSYPFVVLHVALLLPTLPAVLVPHGPVAWLQLVGCGLVVLWGTPLLLVTAWAAFRDDPATSRRVRRLPVVGQVVGAAQTARFAATLGLLHEAGETADVALEEAGHAASGWYLVRLSGACAHVQDGGTLAEAVALLPAAPHELRELVTTGEQAGALGDHMARAAELFGRRAEIAAGRAAALGGALAFALAVLVVLIVIVLVLGPIYAPLFKMV